MTFYHDIETVPDWEKLDQIGPQLWLLKVLLEIPSPYIKVIDTAPADHPIHINPPSEWNWGKYAVCRVLERTPHTHFDIKRHPALIPPFNRIKAIGYAIDDKPVQAGIVTPENERAVLAGFWQMAMAHQPIVGFNCENFDLPVLAYHSRKHGLDVPMIDTAPWKGQLVDIYKAIRYTTMAMPLKSLALSLGIEVPAEGVDGSMVSDMTDKQIMDYQASDIEITRAVHKMLRGGLFWK